MDASTLFEADQAFTQADQASGQPTQTEENIGMEPNHYNAAAKGEIEVFRRISKRLNQLLTPNRNTVLHIHLTSLIKRSEDSKSKDPEQADLKPKDSESSTAFVKEILSLEMCPSLLWQANVKGETPMHIAARYGHAAIVKVLIEHAKSPQHDPESGFYKTVKEMLEMRNNENDTALHEAVRNEHTDIVKLLIEEGSDFTSRNDANETPLYIAVERNFREVAIHILDACIRLQQAHDGPLERTRLQRAHDGPLGRTTLHAAVIWDKEELVDKILKSIAPQDQSAFIKQADKQHWTPLHYAVYFKCYSIPSKLLGVDKSIAYMKDSKGMTALHIAASQSNHRIMENILDCCPDCYELVDNKGWNALHFAVNSSDHEVEAAVEVILKRSTLSNLLNEKDARGNTALHYHSKSLKFIEDLMHHDRVDKMAFNKQNLDAFDIALTSEELSDKKFKEISREFNYNRPKGFRRFFGDDLVIPKRVSDSELRKSYKEARKTQFVSMMNKASEFHLVVDTLIATVTFAAGITMPGGFIGQDDPHSGSAVLTRNAAFRAFVITDTIALVQSFSSAFIHLFMPLLLHEQNPGHFSFVLALLAFCLTISAIGATMLAFVTGTYAVLMHSFDLAIATCVIGLCFFIPAVFITIGCSDYLREMWRMGMSSIIKNVRKFFDALWCMCGCMCLYIGFEAPLYYYFRNLLRRSSNDSDQSTEI